MSTYADVLQHAMKLSSQERSDLVEAILESLNLAPFPDSPRPLSVAWQAEIARRSAEIDAGTAKSFSWDETKTHARERAVSNG